MINEVFDTLGVLIKCTLVALVVAFAALIFYVLRHAREKDRRHPAIGCPPDQWSKNVTHQHKHGDGHHH